jgi:hypothetical protein
MATEKKAIKKTDKPAEGTAEAKPCGIKDCKRPYRAKGLCVTHYKLWRRGELEGHKARYKTCSKEGCRKPRALGGLCAEHAGKGAEAAEAAPAA